MYVTILLHCALECSVSRAFLISMAFYEHVPCNSKYVLITLQSILINIHQLHLYIFSQNDDHNNKGNNIVDHSGIRCSNAVKFQKENIRQSKIKNHKKAICPKI